MRQLKILRSITNRETPSLDKYLQDIGKEELLTSEKEVELAKQIKSGDEKALEKLVRANLRFVVSVAKQYQNQGLSLPDLINDGNLGLIKAAQRFDETRGFKFISYAVWWIRQSILLSLAETSKIVRLPLNQVNSLKKIKKVNSELEQKLERTPSVEEMAIELNIPENKLGNALGIKTHYISLDAPLADDSEMTMHDVFEDTNAPRTDDALMKESLEEEIRRSLKKLPQNQRKIIEVYFGIGCEQMTKNEIEMKFSLTKEEINGLINMAKRHLKFHTNLKKYLEK